jgi:two-component system alkaline phosphatase synthesis response regulator PhoP
MFPDSSGYVKIGTGTDGQGCKVDVLRLLVLAKESEIIQGLVNGLIYRGFACNVVLSEEELTGSKSADLLLVEVGNNRLDSPVREVTQRIKENRRIPIVLLTDKETLPDIDTDPNIDDFILQPYDIEELTARIKRLLKRTVPLEESSDILKAGGVVIDLPKCEVWVRGKVVDLTFTEYELLKLLVSKKGQVLTREVLLNKIWGYDYFGGDRTVDVHITRLRNKIEDTSHGIIETVRNIGYRIK